MRSHVKDNFSSNAPVATDALRAVALREVAGEPLEAGEVVAAVLAHQASVLCGAAYVCV